MEPGTDNSEVKVEGPRDITAPRNHRKHDCFRDSGEVFHGAVVQPNGQHVDTQSMYSHVVET